MKNVSDKICRENKNTLFQFSTFFFENPAVYETVWKNVCRTGLATDDNMAHEHFTLGTESYKHTLLEYVLLISVVLQQRLHEGTSLLLYTYVF